MPRRLKNITADSGGLSHVYPVNALAAPVQFNDKLAAYVARKLPRHPVPAALIARLAVSLQAQG